ncbi:hypothetical protein EN828_25245 [Mesorhizobium sp. M2D.F.Ca.ET.185.01.1.1]|uniref:tetratricopeptide repeat protein n=1 Tax=unclassified Mesorhizobium TaxID=325217 RepID=UPI000FCCB463|nr:MULTISPECIES: hypothetical protein [unclassified Mesorhizobium]TGP74358.1 hypothetical protein EN870_27065 [bacterium M00.F.Ca.ET.227.01.1.1]TGP85044.1 hypothetical protein EN864_27170 [bacterium M00.F.Ca.ET.221.01.1.1]TGP89127.1 hypothetical protein EN865_25595 [bacterium M00.F.Ca.ET.222.01.1.1]TGU12815.1 hypothetical protein EN806_15670 [bacterium M00.F.Ca.ET.163.01.1.1]TGU21282.1 hypothetical protein EN799_53930 [bacterium M00.F.Ca.ET.156.01.1.1]TGU43679.1 hypothetical protein EN789_261
MKKIAAYAAFCFLLCSDPSRAADTDAGAPDTHIIVNFSASPASDATEVGVSRGFTSIVLSKQVAADLKPASVEPGELNGQPYAVYVRWNDSTESSFPIFLISAFAKQEVEVDFVRAQVTKDSVSSVIQANCNALNPSTQQQAFKTMALCGAASRWLRANGESLSDADLQALNSWFVANRWLYYRKDGEIQLSPYGLEPDLVAALADILDRVQNGARPNSFKPLDIRTVSQTLTDHDEEPVRMASFVPKLVKEKRFEEALSINQYALDAYDNLSGGDDTKVIVHVTKAVLNNNAKYINSLLQSTGVSIDEVNKQRLVLDAKAGIEQENPDIISKSAETLIASYPDDYTGYSYMGIASFYRNDFPSAVSNFREASNRLLVDAENCSPPKRGVLGNLGAALGSTNDYKGAVDTLKNVVDCAPPDKMDLFNFAKNALAMGDFKLAKDRIFGDSVLLKATRPDLRSRTALMRGLYFVESKEDGWIDQAVDEFRSSICLDPHLRQVILGDETLDDPGSNKVEEYGWEKHILKLPENKELSDRLQESLSKESTGCNKKETKS